MSLAMLLETMGNEVRYVYDGSKAIELAAQYRPDVVLLDIGMPGLNGYDTCRGIRSQPENKSALIIALTGWSQETDRQQSRDAGFDFHLIKPVELAALEKVLKDLGGPAAE